MRLLVLLFTIIFTVPASAATYRLDVTGTISEITFLGSYVWDRATGQETRIGSVSYSFSDLDFQSHYAGYQAWFSELRKNTGSFRFDAFDDHLSGNPYTNVRYSNCKGLLKAHCGDGIFALGFHQTSHSYGYSELTTSRVIYEDDSTNSWTDSDGTDYFNMNGIYYSGTIDRYTITAVPVPASGSVLLLALGGFVQLRRRQRRLCSKVS